MHDKQLKQTFLYRTTIEMDHEEKQIKYTLQFSFGVVNCPEVLVTHSNSNDTTLLMIIEISLQFTYPLFKEIYNKGH